MISNFNYGSLYGTNKDFYSQSRFHVLCKLVNRSYSFIFYFCLFVTKVSNNLEQYDEEENLDIIKRQQMHSKKQTFLYDAPSVQNLESFNLDQHLDMNRYSIDFASSELNNREVSKSFL